MTSTTDVPLGEGFLIDSNVLLDIFGGESEWRQWSAATIAQCIRAGACHINPMIFSEVSYGFDDLEQLEAVLPSDVFRHSALPFPAAFLAARSHHAYRRRGGTKVATLPDFFIGAHAVVEGLTLVTRDPRRYRLAFPSLKLVAP